jgi:hypothetical protein
MLVLYHHGGWPPPTMNNTTDRRPPPTDPPRQQNHEPPPLISDTIGVRCPHLIERWTGPRAAVSPTKLAPHHIIGYVRREMCSRWCLVSACLCFGVVLMCRMASAFAISFGMTVEWVKCVRWYIFWDRMLLSPLPCPWRYSYHPRSSSKGRNRILAGLKAESEQGDRV